MKRQIDIVNVLRLLFGIGLIMPGLAATVIGIVEIFEAPGPGILTVLIGLGMLYMGIQLIRGKMKLW